MLTADQPKAQRFRLRLRLRELEPDEPKVYPAQAVTRHAFCKCPACVASASPLVAQFVELALGCNKVGLPQEARLVVFSTEISHKATYDQSKL